MFVMRRLQGSRTARYDLRYNTVYCAFGHHMTNSAIRHSTFKTFLSIPQEVPLRITLIARPMILRKRSPSLISLGLRSYSTNNIIELNLQLRNQFVYTVWLGSASFPFTFQYVLSNCATKEY